MEGRRESSSKPPSTTGRRRWALYAALVALFLLRYDFWLWNDTRLVLGLPVGLLYHVVFCLVTSLVLAMLVKWAWPRFDVDADERRAPAREDGGEWSPRSGDPKR